MWCALENNYVLLLLLLSRDWTAHIIKSCRFTALWGHSYTAVFGLQVQDQLLVPPDTHTQTQANFLEAPPIRPVARASPSLPPFSSSSFAPFLKLVASPSHLSFGKQTNCAHSQLGFLHHPIELLFCRIVCHHCPAQDAEEC
jgi:hypothetical protein